MPFIAFLVILCCGAGIFWLIAYLLRKRMARVSLALGIIGTLAALFFLSLWGIELSGWQSQGLYKQLMYGLENEDLRQFINEKEDHYEQSIFMLSLTAGSLNEYAHVYPEQKNRILTEFDWMIQYIMDEDRFPVWKNRRNWGNELFFLTHAAIIIAHYQSVTGLEEYDESWKRICEFIATGITRSKYKHMASRPKDKALRPADNAAALYALKLFDDAHQTDLLSAAAEDWTYYIERELQFEDTKLPCAGFTTTNRCNLSPVGGSLAMLNVYAAGAKLTISKDFWREFRYYYKETFVNVFGWITLIPRGADLPEFCDFSVAPLTCGRYENSLGIYAAALREDWITYYQLNNASLMNDLLHPPNQLWNQPLQEQLYGMITLAARLSAGMKPS